MSKYIKVKVPDSYDPDIHGFYLYNTTDELEDYEPVDAFKPEYRNVLDHGFIGLVDFMGDDDTIVNAARTSYDKGTKRLRGNEGLIRYLMRHRHATPTEMCEFMFHVKAPIFVFRQWHRHRAASINEMSARYSILDNEMYVPEISDVKPQASDNKQGRSGEMSEENYRAVVCALEHAYQETYTAYKYMMGPFELVDGHGNTVTDNGNKVMVMPTAPDQINNRALFARECALKAMNELQNRMAEKGETVEFTTDDIEAKVNEYLEANEVYVTDKDFTGIARELARMVLPVSTYSQMYWKADLRSIFNFISLRSDPHAQKEIRVYSDEMLDLIRPIVPISVNAFIDYQMNGVNLSKAEYEVVRELIADLGGRMGADTSDQNVDSIITSLLEERGASKREIAEFTKKFTV